MRPAELGPGQPPPVETVPWRQTEGVEWSLQGWVVVETSRSDRFIRELRCTSLPVARCCFGHQSDRTRGPGAETGARPVEVGLPGGEGQVCRLRV